MKTAYEREILRQMKKLMDWYRVESTRFWGSHG